MNWPRRRSSTKARRPLTGVSSALRLHWTVCGASSGGMCTPGLEIVSWGLPIRFSGARLAQRQVRSRTGQSPVRSGPRSRLGARFGRASGRQRVSCALKWARQPCIVSGGLREDPVRFGHQGTLWAATCLILAQNTLSEPTGRLACIGDDQVVIRGVKQGRRGRISEDPDIEGCSGGFLALIPARDWLVVPIRAPCELRIDQMSFGLSLAFWV